LKPISSHFKGKKPIQAALKEVSHFADVPAALRVNSDQTNVQIVPGANETWNEAGQKQVTVNGKDDKRAFMVMNGISASGIVLPLQAIYAGKTATVLPKRMPENANALG
jgi:hypothetical protein